MNLGVLLTVLNSMIVSISSACMKQGSELVNLKQPLMILKNKWVLFSLSLSPCTFVLNVMAYHYADITVLHPLRQLSLIWNVILAMVLFNETISTRTMLGIVLIISGAIVITVNP
jgi:drug/metabolite transporter (DMT)-like permease